MFLCHRTRYLQKIRLRIRIYETHYEVKSLHFCNLHVSVIFFLQYWFTLAVNDEVISCRIELMNRPININAWAIWVTYPCSCYIALSQKFTYIRLCKPGEGDKWDLGWFWLFATSPCYCMCYYVNSKIDGEHLAQKGWSLAKF